MLLHSHIYFPESRVSRPHRVSIETRRFRIKVSESTSTLWTPTPLESKQPALCINSSVAAVFLYFPQSISSALKRHGRTLWISTRKFRYHRWKERLPDEVGAQIFSASSLPRNLSRLSKLRESEERTGQRKRIPETRLQRSNTDRDILRSVTSLVGDPWSLCRHSPADSWPFSNAGIIFTDSGGLNPTDVPVNRSFITNTLLSVRLDSPSFDANVKTHSGKDSELFSRLGVIITDRSCCRLCRSFHQRCSFKTQFTNVPVNRSILANALFHVSFDLSSDQGPRFRANLEEHRWKDTKMAVLQQWSYLRW